MLGPRSMDARSQVPKPLQHQRSTKQLISRYESMNNAIALPRQSPYAAASPSSYRPLVVPMQNIPTASRKKDKSPIRQSFRNLLSVFKRGSMPSKDKSDGMTTPPRHRTDRLSSDIPPEAALPHLPTSAHTAHYLAGPLLYLSRTPQALSNSPILPVWTTCTATLENDKIILSSFTAHGNPSIHTIRLSHCADVRSLSLSQLDPAETALLPRRGDCDELKVFEILFEGRAREKFAATSIRERAGWVSAIWDAILPSQEPRLTNKTVRGGSEYAEIDLSSPHHTLPSESSAPTHIPAASPLLELSHPERSLPPIPMEKNSGHLLPATNTRTVRVSPTSREPASPSIYASTRPASRTSSCMDSRSGSPSIANLGQLSVVKLRLAQIERDASQTSNYSLTSPTSSQTSRFMLMTPLLNSAATHPGASVKTEYPKTIQPSGAESVVDPYDVLLDYANQSSEPLPSVFSSICRKPPQDLPSGSVSYNCSTAANICLEPFTELLQDHATKNYSQLANLGDQIIALQNDVQNLPRELASGISGGASQPTLYTMMSDIGERIETNERTLTLIQGNLAVSDEQWAETGPTDQAGAPGVLETLRSMRLQMATDFPAVLTKLNQIQQEKQEPDTGPMNLSNLAASRLSATAGSPSVELLELHAKMDDLLGLYSATTQGGNYNVTTLEGQKFEFSKIIALVEKSEDQRILQAQQQTESVRYLNELNMWLEAFVNDGTSQIQGLAKNVDQLCQGLGCTSKVTADESSSLLTDVRHLVHILKAREQGSTVLQESVASLLAAMGEESRNASNLGSITSLIQRQCQDQEALLRALTADLSDEIKGERLRFVEAMKEATAINVQIHVEQFKKELTREVLGMTEEVGRLHRERQAMENQIADLFAFYTKQKQAGIALTVAQTPSHHVSEQYRPRPSQRRPLPHPQRA